MYRYDLNRMLKEIKEDEHTGNSSKKEMDQDEIKKMMLERLKNRRGKKE